MTDLQIIPAKMEDLENILRLQKECYQTEAELYNDFNIPPLVQSLESVKEDFTEGTLFLKGVKDGNILGSVRGFSRNGTAYIGRLIVKKEFQNNKIGQRLMQAIESRLDDCSRYELFTGHRSEKNIKLYQKLGYQEFKRQLINDRLTLVYLEKMNKV